MPQVEVSFDVDANGILSVTAKDKASGKSQSIRIEASSGLSKEEIEKMQKDAELHADEDAKKKDAADVKTTADMTIFTAEKAIKDAGDKVSADVKSGVETKIADLKTVKEGADLEAIKKATEALSNEMMKIGEAMNKAGQTPEGGTTAEPQPEESKEAGASEPSGPQKNDGDNVQDAETK